MKFAKELDQEAVPEWRIKYLNYKAGKKHVKAVTRAINRANATPTLALTRRADGPPANTPATFFGITHAFTPPKGTGNPASGAAAESSGRARAGSTPLRPGKDANPENERSGLARSPGSGIQYGSIGPSPSRASDRNDFELPAPAMRVPTNTGQSTSVHSAPLSRLALQRSASMAAADHRSPSLLTLPSAGSATTPRLRVPRIFTTGSTAPRTTPTKLDIGMQNLDYVRSAERDFFAFLDSELDKIESFYKEKEDQATERLAALRAQLHEMRNRRTEEIADAKRRRELAAGRSRSRSEDDSDGQQHAKDHHHANAARDWVSPLRDRFFFKPGPNSKALQKMTRTPILPDQNTIYNNATSNTPGRDYVRRPSLDDGVPYRTAKRKLKLAMQEFYRSLELLKSYALLNRTAFRKLNKKYDKAVHARPPYRYLNERVNRAWFVNSDVLEGHIRTVEDLYARYFEKGNHKIAAGKLRNLHKRSGDASGSAFRSGVLVGLGGVFAVQGLVYGAEILLDGGSSAGFVENTGYVLQLYGGYFLILLLFVLFTLDCRMWTKNKVNYPFIFEFDPRDFLSWKELAEFPSFFFALFGFFLWLNFSRLGNWEVMYLYYPVVLIGITLVILFLPAPVLHYKARRWFLYSHYRLLLSGLYPVEFRDFFLGDIWCSLTYATCNIELFFCLYANSWQDPSQCNSSHSRLLGFFGTLPPIWRALQCIRRYHDTRNVFPHLVNCGKYTMTILTAVCLSLYRIGDSHVNLSLYIAVATINAVYCSIWDLFMDFSLLQAHAHKRLLRDITAIRPVWIYYLIMVVDPILRFSWIFYAIFTHDAQHSTIVSFVVSFSEVVRRGLWTLLRVENEHCANVAQYKASRDTPLPYHLEQYVQRPSLEAVTAAAAVAAAVEMGGGAVPPGGLAFSPTTPKTPGVPTTPAATAPGAPSQRLGPTPMPMPTPRSEPPAAGTTTGMEPPTPRTPAAATISTVAGGEAADAEQAGGYFPGPGPGPGTIRRRRTVLQAMAEAHKQDFEKKRLPVGAGREEDADRLLAAAEDEDEEEEEEEDEEAVEGSGANEEEESKSEDEDEDEVGAGVGVGGNGNGARGGDGASTGR